MSKTRTPLKIRPISSTPEGYVVPTPLVIQFMLQSGNMFFYYSLYNFIVYYQQYFCYIVICFISEKKQRYSGENNRPGKNTGQMLSHIFV